MKDPMTDPPPAYVQSVLDDEEPEPDARKLALALKLLREEKVGPLKPETMNWLKVAAENSGLTREAVVELLVGGATMRTVMSGEHGG